MQGIVSCGKCTSTFVNTSGSVGYLAVGLSSYVFTQLQLSRDVQEYSIWELYLFIRRAFLALLHITRHVHSDDVPASITTVLNIFGSYRHSLEPTLRILSGSLVMRLLRELIRRYRCREKKQAR